VVAGNLHLERPGRILLASVAVSGAAMLVVAVAPVLVVTMAALAVMGLMVGFVNIVAVSWLQARIAQDMLGRVMSLAMLVGFGITPLSLGVAGALLDVNATLLFAGSGLLVIGVAVAAALSRYPSKFDAPSPILGTARPEPVTA